MFHQFLSNPLVLYPIALLVYLTIGFLVSLILLIVASESDIYLNDILNISIFSILSWPLGLLTLACEMISLLGKIRIWKRFK